MYHLNFKHKANTDISSSVLNTALHLSLKSFKNPHIESKDYLFDTFTCYGHKVIVLMICSQHIPIFIYIQLRVLLFSFFQQNIEY